MFMRGPLRSFSACSGNPFQVHAAQAVVTGFPWAAVTSSFGLLAPLRPCKETCELIRQVSLCPLGYTEDTISSVCFKVDLWPVEGGVTKKELLFGDICALRDAKQLRIKPVLLIRMRWLYTLPLILI